MAWFRNSDIDNLQAEVCNLKDKLSQIENGFKSEVKALKDENWKLMQRVAHLETKTETFYKLNCSSIRGLNKRTKHLEEGRKRSLLK